MRGSWTRRKFLVGAGGALALPIFVPRQVLGGEAGPAPSERVDVAIVGLGGRARGIVGESRGLPMNIVAVCDCYLPAAERFAKDLSQGQSWKIYDDVRQMLDKEKSIQAVMVETTTHARAWVTILCMQAGKDVYIEKPMCLTIEEGRRMVQAARKYGRVTQVGTQQRSMPINNWASDLVKTGKLGKCLTVIAPNFIGPDCWKDQPEQPLPPGGRKNWWDEWTNQAVYRPYHPALHHGWARWWDYDGGGLCFGVTGWGTHSYDQVNRALGTDDTGPVEIVLEEKCEVRDSGRFAPRQTVGGVVIGETGDIDTGTDYHHMAKLRGPRAKVTMKFATGTELKLHLDGDRGPGLGAIFICEQGKIEINRNKLASNPKDIVRSPDNPGPITRPETSYHIENWLECIKTRGRCTADIEIGQRSTTLCHLVNIVREVGRVGEVLRWDPVAERFTNCDEANKLLSRPRRPGYELPI